MNRRQDLRSVCLKRWNGYHDHRIKTTVRHDTLYLDFPAGYKDIYEKCS